MKKFRKIMAVLVATIMVVAMTVPTWAATITVSRDSFDGDDSTLSGRRIFWRRIFNASYVTGDFTGTGDNAGAHNYDNDGAAQLLTGDESHPVAYTASSTMADALGTIAGNKSWTADGTNTYFTLTYAPGGDYYNVRAATNGLDSATKVQNAAEYLWSLNTYEAQGELTWDAASSSWKSGNLPAGYYVLSSDAGKNLIAATTDVTIKEKNMYPVIAKTQQDEGSGGYGTATINSAIEDIINYQVTVTVPKTVAVNDRLLVYDIPSSGLTYTANSASAPSNNKYEITDADAAEIPSGGWAKVITVKDATLGGSDIVFSFDMTVNKYTLTDKERVNTTYLKYGRDTYTYQSNKVTVPYTTYFAGIYKYDKQEDVDSTPRPLQGVTFDITEDGTDFNVAFDTDGGYYYPKNSGGSKTVTTDSNGLIRFRGLDSGKTYVLTEKSTNAGYYLHEQTITLITTEDKPATFTSVEKIASNFNGSTTYYKLTGGNYVEAGPFADSGQFVASEDALYTKDSGSDNFASNTTWVRVPNEAGTVLPATGGMGTTVLYIVGGMLVILAGAYLFFSRKKTA